MENNLDKEYQKLADLEFEYKIIEKFAEDESELIIARGKYLRQLSKIKKLEKLNAESEGMDIKTQEE